MCCKLNPRRRSARSKPSHRSRASHIGSGRFGCAGGRAMSGVSNFMSHQFLWRVIDPIPEGAALGDALAQQSARGVPRVLSCFELALAHPAAAVLQAQLVTLNLEGAVFDRV